MNLWSIKRKLRKIRFHLQHDRFNRALAQKAPTHVQIETTVRCNLHCGSCTRESVITSYKKQNMSMESVQQILEKIPNLKSVKFQGLGEPLLTDNIENILPLFKERKIQLWTITNGTLLEKSKYRKLLTEYFQDVTVSIDSTSSELFKKLRSGADLEKIKAGLQLLIQDRNLQNPGLSIGINYCLSPDNLTELSSLYKFAVDLKLDYVSIVPAENWTTPQDPHFQKFHKLASETRLYQKQIRSFVRQLRAKLFLKGIVLGFKDNTERLGKCAWPFRHLFVNVEGEITPCCLRMHREYSFGNIFSSNSLNEIWNGPNYHQLRKAHIEKDRTNNTCGNCPL